MENVPAVRQQAVSKEDIQLVSFMVNNEEYGVEVLKVREIIRFPEITKMPNAPEFVEGVINLRGTVVPIISLRSRFGMPDCDRNRTTRIMVMDVCGSLSGFVVDAVSEVVRTSTADILPPPAVTTSGSENGCISGILNKDGRMIIMMDADQLFHSIGYSGLTH